MIDFEAFPTTLTAAVFLTGSAALVILDYCNRARQQRRQIASAARPANHLSSPGMASSSLPPVTIDTSVLQRMVLPEQPSEPASIVEPSSNMIFERAPMARAKQPTGMIAQPDLDALLERETQFQGLVVSIGINDSDSSMWYSPRFLQQVGSHFADLLEGQDICCRTAFDEFVLVCPNEQGAQAQRRLHQISERLWEFQLRGRSACSSLFSWGAARVQDRPLAEAIADATDLMRQTKRSSPSEVAHSRAV